MGPHLGKLVKLHTLDIACTRCLHSAIFTSVVHSLHCVQVVTLGPLVGEACCIPLRKLLVSKR